MKKSLIALAALAAVSAVSAQSTVSVYGRLDMGYSSANQTNAWGIVLPNTSTAFQEQKTSTTSLGANNSRTTSRLGFSGVEDLGGGLKAMFNYELGLNADNIGTHTGTANKTMSENDGTRIGFGNTRLANIGVSGGFGTVVLGTFLNAHDAMRGYNVNTFGMAGGDFMSRHNANQSDASGATIGATFVGAATAYMGNTVLFANSTAANSTATTGVTGTAVALKAINGVGFNGRSHNAVAYSSPSISGFTVGLGVQADRTSRTANPTSQAADTRSVSGETISLTYAAGPLKATYVNGSSKLVDMDNTSTSAYTSLKNKDAGFAASYDLGVAQVFLMNESVTGNVTGGLLGGYSVKTAATEVGVKFPMGALTPYVVMGQGKITINNTTADSVFKTTATQYGTTYDLSKRSYMYAAYGADKVTLSGVGLKRSGTTIGLVHSF
jgi:predicted porin